MENRLSRGFRRDVIRALAIAASIALLGSCGKTESPANKVAAAGEATPAARAVPAAPATTITLFASPNTDSTPVWGAIAQGFYTEAGLDVQVKVFPSGTTALQSFRTGQGDISMSGELPSVNYWGSVDGDYRVITPMTRHTQGYVAETLSSIKAPKDLIGKTIATRVGSSGSWFVAEFLKKNGIAPDQVKLINLDTNQMPIALDKGDIAGFFVWQPFGFQAEALSGDKVHALTTAQGYIRGYTVLGARPAWLEKNKDAAVRFIAATQKGATWAKEHPDQFASYLEKNYGTDPKQTMEVMKYIDLTMAFDPQFYEDFASVAAYSKDVGNIKQTMDWSTYLWTDGLQALGGGRVTTPPRP
jgi:ABC-type nitrate/sulfonate/bicarbonate transport system substrate-binding protein